MLVRGPFCHLDLDGHLADGELYLLAIGPLSDDDPIGRRGVFHPQRDHQGPLDNLQTKEKLFGH